MPLTLRIQDPDTGEETPIVIPDYEEITVGHWRGYDQLNKGVEDIGELELGIERAAWYTGIPVERFRLFPVSVAVLVLEHVGKQIAKAQQGSERFAKCLEDGTDFVPDEVVTIAGRHYTVPLNMDGVLISQFADWNRWEPPQHEADIIAEACAFMLVEVGEQYRGTPKEKVDAMQQMPIQLGFDLCAFFFSRSEMYRSVTHLRYLKFQGWMRQLHMDTLKITEGGIEALTSSTELPN